jgi:hypothetical protein
MMFIFQLRSAIASRFAIYCPDLDQECFGKAGPPNERFSLDHRQLPCIVHGFSQLIFARQIHIFEYSLCAVEPVIRYRGDIEGYVKLSCLEHGLLEPFTLKVVVAL